jgi:hypothetical protein
MKLSVMKCTEGNVVVKDKVVCLCALKTYFGSRGTASHILTLAEDGGEWLASWSGCFTPGKDLLVPFE